jgi:hypothetical protein
MIDLLSRQLNHLAFFFLMILMILTFMVVLIATKINIFGSGMTQIFVAVVGQDFVFDLAVVFQSQTMAVVFLGLWMQNL